MSRSRCKALELVRQIRLAAIVFLCGLIFATGCKTSEDAAAAATQMSATAKSLADYYAALETILDNTDQVYILNAQLYHKPYNPENRQLLKSNQDELDKRIKLATDFSTLAAEFAQLTGSTASADVSASALKLQTEVTSLASINASKREQGILKAALGLLVTAIQEHKERKAARAIGDFATGLNTLFVKEAPVWTSVDQVFNAVAGVLATNLVDDNATDNSGLFKVALGPFGLVPAASSADFNSKLAPLAKDRIASRKAQLNASFDQATVAMAKSLDEMSKRIHLVADDKPMSFRVPPLTLATVEKWADQVASL